MRIDLSGYNILPCQCGATPIMDKESACDGVFYRMRCPECGISSGLRSYEIGYEAVNAWNSRMRELGVEVDD